MWVKCLLYMVVVMFVAGSQSFAQSPVENVILKYDDVKGAKDFIAQGGARLSIAKGFLKNTPVASLASDVDEVSVLRMGNTSQASKTAFLKDLKSALRSYEYHGEHPSNNGNVEVYVKRNGAGQITELVIYNPELYNLNVLHGTFPLDALMKLE